MASVRRIGRLKHRVELLQQTAGVDALGRQNRTEGVWTVLDTVWAEVRELSATEVERAKQIVQMASHAVSIRYRSGVVAQQRVRFRSRVFEIRAVLDSDSSQRELLLLCGEVR